MFKQENKQEDTMLESISKKLNEARKKRSAWEGHWKECYDYVLPQRQGMNDYGLTGAKRTENIYDATAVNAVDQLSASLLSELTPAWSRWFNLVPGPDLSDEEAELIQPELDKANRLLQSHFDQSNFIVEIHQCYQDLVTAGTASLLFEEAKPGEFSAFHFKAIPLSQLYPLETDDGRLGVTFRCLKLTAGQMKSRFKEKILELDIKQDESDTTHQVVEAVLPCENGYDYFAFYADGNKKVLLEQGRFRRSPFINFRWSKSPGEIFGRSPVMKSLPDIKTANKVVELILKNASIAVTGIWQADDDGVLNPANIKLTPGTIIPKAVGSAGLKPLEMPGKFDISQLVLEDLRGRIRHALLVDRLGEIGQSNMTATEVVERSTEIARILAATYGRLQSELLTPLVLRAHSILRRRGEILDMELDGRRIALSYTSPLAKAQSQRDVQSVMSWVSQAISMGDETKAMVDLSKVAKLLSQSMGIPGDLIRDPNEVAIITQEVQET